MKTRIITVTLNAAIDKTYYLAEVMKGRVLRAEKVLAVAGGKGVNVARVLRQLGHEDVAVTGFAGGYNGRFIADQVREYGIIEEFVKVRGESRLCLNFMDSRDGSSTEVLEPGPELGREQAEEMKAKIGALASQSRLIIFSGSIPRGLPADFYADLIRIASSCGAEVFLDASGEPLAHGLAAVPQLIKPNADEIRPWLTGSGERAVAAAVTKLMDKGIPNVVVTLGEEGALAGIKGRIYRIHIPRIAAVNTVGSGDAFLAGFAYGYVRGWSSENCLRHAAAAGCANALSPIAGDVDVGNYENLLQEVSVETWL
ncbi:1-phosphofructokinase family hexose kinase [Cohnella pontilimi]|uniref:Tagatose-6-phosphate kinase n=1 Tax=Cohnella pontilimi TaxID=2564100 RepID=A0A4U0FA36_9BACL|nr:1-phosphofructokinase family hexose kinase [Cohnella pontilimi]TJY41501.1 1-phosphofructokinase family hexose kinase [Cohnella pontilimi]